MIVVGVRASFINGWLGKAVTLMSLYIYWAVFWGDDIWDTDSGVMRYGVMM